MYKLKMQTLFLQPLWVECYFLFFEKKIKTIQGFLLPRAFCFGCPVDLPLVRFLTSLSTQRKGSLG